jgi:hypothetical protein
VNRVVVLAPLLAFALAAPVPAAAQPDDLETFRGTTTGAVSSEGVELRINVLRWTGDEDRGAVLSLITPAPGETAGEGEDLEGALQDLQTVGFIWTGGSLGYALKYAHRTEDEDGGERIVLVTDRPLGRWDRNGPWTGSDGSAPAAAAFTVVELHLDAEDRGEGKMSVGAPIEFNPPAGIVGLADYASAAVHLRDVYREPPPYSAR